MTWFHQLRIGYSILLVDFGGRGTVECIYIHAYVECVYIHAHVDINAHAAAFALASLLDCSRFKCVVRNVMNTLARPPTPCVGGNTCRNMHTK